ncbi:LOW QUALITY PROTEIN: hypothetical protein BT93_H1518 [Corymbia citriodora subsp. variegata]|nr:LOW QUALITY PROTEIN: hypothetical protein BT93_H1518 [Corymbia citriodora subsp. variegata]
MALALATFTEKNNCKRTRGNISVPFPFGLDKSCARNSSLVLSCNHKSGNLVLGKNVPVFNISVESTTMIEGLIRSFRLLTLGEAGHHTFSDTGNKLLVLGCDTLALITDASNTFESGCFSYCSKAVNFMAEGARSGIGCCQTSIPKSLRSLSISLGSMRNYTSIQSFSSCGSAFVVDQEPFNVVVDWVVERALTCEEPQLNQSRYASGTNSNCSDFENGKGYRCFYIDECEDPVRYPCHWNCKNTPGNYTCDCPFGTYGDGKLAKATNNYDASNKLGEGGFASIYKGRIDGDVLVTVKKPRDVLVKKPKDMNKDSSLSTHDECLHKISSISQVNHKNLVKLLGICLETKVPLLVYEFIPNGTLYHHIHDKRSMVLQSWKNRLRIASEVALVLECLHSLADPLVIQSDVKSLNILLDEKYSAKDSILGLSFDFTWKDSYSRKNTRGYLDPEYLTTGELTTKCDVYSFGVVLVELLTGEMLTRQAKSGEKINIIRSFISAVENQTLLHMINFEASNEGEVREIEAVGLLARRCLNYNGVNRPTMLEVAEQSARINKNLWSDQRNNEETQCLLSSRCDSLWTSTDAMNKQELTNLLVFDIEATTCSSSI